MSFDSEYPHHEKYHDTSDELSELGDILTPPARSDDGDASLDTGYDTELGPNWIMVYPRSTLGYPFPLNGGVVFPAHLRVIFTKLIRARTLSTHELSQSMQSQSVAAELTGRSVMALTRHVQGRSRRKPTRTTSS